MSEIGKSVTIIMEQKLTNLVQAVKSLINDIEAMQDKDNPDWFGPFDDYDELEGTIEWPNIRISLADLQTALNDWEKSGKAND